ncbi:MAG: hypothetical protein KDB70_08475 [Mycobacterium sp.]|nr:hypothetical protein [Mycobacterium sp.]
MFSLGVDPVDLALSADHMDMHGNDLRVAHGAANAAIEGAAVGWVGTSAVALQGFLVDLETVTNELCGHVETLGQKFRIAYQEYVATDQDGADSLAASGGSTPAPSETDLGLCL